MSGQTGNQPSYYNPNNERSWTDGTRLHLLISNGQESVDIEYARVMGAQGYPWTEEDIQAAQQENASRPFSIL